MTLQEMVMPGYEIGKNYLISNADYHVMGNSMSLFYEKSRSCGEYHHFLKCLIPDISEKIAGYSYFKISPYEHTSSFIGMKVNNAFLGSGLGMLLFAEWVKTSLDAEGYSLKLQKRQVKPGIIYIAKKFGFEIKDAGARYAESPRTIFICDKEGVKHLLFKDKDYQKLFQRLKVNHQGNNKYIDPDKDTYTEVDRVLLGHTYYLEPQSIDYAYEKAETVINSFKI